MVVENEQKAFIRVIIASFSNYTAGSFIPSSCNLITKLFHGVKREFEKLLGVMFLNKHLKKFMPYHIKNLKMQYD